MAFYLLHNYMDFINFNEFHNKLILYIERNNVKKLKNTESK